MDYYVLLTGGKNNAGDFLIKHRAHSLLKELRPDREIKDFNAWEPLDDEKLEIVNNSKALILMGGPSVQENMYPGIYKLCSNLDQIKVPVIAMGVGWKSQSGNWEDVRNYRMSEKSKELLQKVNQSDFYSSVRDYHTMHVLKEYGVEKVMVTGCPALYSLDDISKPVQFRTPKVINFSLGVEFAGSKAMERSVKQMILDLKERFNNEIFSVKFHHSIQKSFLETPGANQNLFKSNLKFCEWLEEKGISYEDISGSAENLINSYSSCDLHIGYRVHAHIFMSGISKPSILIAEDGRGKALRTVLGGVIFDGFIRRKDGIHHKILNKTGLPFDRFEVDENLSKRVIQTIDVEFENEMPRMRSVRNNIDLHYQVMKKFTAQLP